MTNDDIAREVLATTSYVVLSTADADGMPWASPVWFATEDNAELFWVSHPGARHSRNIAARPQIAMVAFDSTAAPMTGQGVYLTAAAEQMTDPTEVARGIDVFSRQSVRRGARAMSLDDVTGEARLRFYRAQVHESWILDPDSPYDVRVGVEL